MKIKEEPMAPKQNSSKLNAIKHGVFVGTLLSGPGSAEVEYFEQLLAGARVAIRPTNAVEEALTEMIAFQILRLRRANKADTEIAPELFARVKDFLKERKKESPILTFDESVESKKAPTIDSLIRYETTIVRQISRMLSLIQQLRQVREIEMMPTSQSPNVSEALSSRPPQDPELRS